MRPWLCLIPFLLAAAPATTVSDVWKRLPETTNQCPEEYDYFPGGGLRILWCHAKEALSIEQIQGAVGVPIWSSGPHSVRALNLKSVRSFGHYNPVFVDRASRLVLVGVEDAAFREATQPVYDGILREKARIAWAVHEKLRAEPACARRELDAYVANMRGTEPEPYFYGRWYFFMDPAYCTKGSGPAVSGDGGWNGNVADTLVGFWLRRRIDGTETRFANALTDLLRTYDAAWFAGAKDSLAG